VIACVYAVMCVLVLYLCVQFHYKQEGNYSIGSVGITDVDCDFVSFTYVSSSYFQLNFGRCKSLFCSVPFSSLGMQEGHPTCKKFLARNPQRFFLGTFPNRERSPKWGN